MKINYTTKNERINVEITSDSVKETFKKLAEFQEVFDQQSCGLCNQENIKFIVRTVDNNDYFELKCQDCHAKLAFGQHKTGGSLFPKRKNKAGSYDTKNHGWHKWNVNSSKNNYIASNNNPYNNKISINNSNLTTTKQFTKESLT